MSGQRPNRVRGHLGCRPFGWSPPPGCRHDQPQRNAARRCRQRHRSVRTRRRSAGIRSGSPARTATSTSTPISAVSKGPAAAYRLVRRSVTSAALATPADPTCISRSTPAAAPPASTPTPRSASSAERKRTALGGQDVGEDAVGVGGVISPARRRRSGSGKGLAVGHRTLGAGREQVCAHLHHRRRAVELDGRARASPADWRDAP